MLKLLLSPFFIVVILSASIAYSAGLSNISDTISTSAPGSGANHTITFTATNIVPESGSIVITPQGGVFTIPSGLDFTDVDVFNGSVEFPVAAIPGNGSGSAVGVTAGAGSSADIVVKLNDTDSINAGSTVTIKIGTNATSGDQQIQNPSLAGSYQMHVATRNQANVLIDEAYTVIAIIDPIGVSGEITQCSDGVDNDSDGKIDYPSDPGCSSASDNDETDSPPPPPSSGGGGGSGGSGGSSTINLDQIPDPSQVIKGDLNGDGVVDLVDFSIMAFWYKRISPPKHVDLNGDGEIDLVDFSIMAFYWTG